MYWRKAPDRRAAHTRANRRDPIRSRCEIFNIKAPLRRDLRRARLPDPASPCRSWRSDCKPASSCCCGAIAGRTGWHEPVLSAGFSACRQERCSPLCIKDLAPVLAATPVLSYKPQGLSQRSRDRGEQVISYLREKTFMVKSILMIGVILMLWSSSATAEERLTGAPCVADLNRLCPSTQPGDDRLLDCMRAHLRDVSDQCLERLGKFAEVRGYRSDCRAHIQKQCASVELGQLGACLRSAIASLSDSCSDALVRAFIFPAE
jgi:hypothetical protein